ncbi:MAG: DsbA family protein [Solirubrobacteraceae bacterium]
MDSAFYFDLSSPLAYLAAERILHVMPGPVEWRPVLSGKLPNREPFDAPAIEQCALELGLQPLRWPADFPFDSELAMLVATYAKSIGRVVPFAQAAFRQAFAGGRSLAGADNVLIAAAACEMHPTAVLSAAKLTSVVEQLSATTTEAAERGVSGVPALHIKGRVFIGSGALDEALAA